MQSFILIVVSGPSVLIHVLITWCVLKKEVLHQGSSNKAALLCQGIHYVYDWCVLQAVDFSMDLDKHAATITPIICCTMLVLLCAARRDMTMVY